VIRIIRLSLSFDEGMSVCRVKVPHDASFLEYRSRPFGMGDFLYTYEHPEGSRFVEWQIHRVPLYRPAPRPQCEAFYFIGSTEDYALFLSEGP
jgi:hypothetical protein